MDLARLTPMTGAGCRAGAGRRLRAATAVVLAVLAAGLASAPPAAADLGINTPDGRYYRTSVTSVTPRIPGVSVDATATGEWLRVTNTTTTTLIVLGYSGEPYVRLGPGGADENVASLSSYLNSSLVISQLPQDVADWAGRSPKWEHRGSAPTFEWHDHRIHWMNATRPPVVAASPDKPHRVTTWTVRMLHGTTPVEVVGTLDWLGKPSLLSDPRSKVLWGLASVAFVLMLVQMARILWANHHARRRAAASP